MNLETAAAAFTIGLLGAGHCIGMCGGVSAALTFAIEPGQLRRKFIINLYYNLGRISSYCLLAAVFGLMTGVAAKATGLPTLRIIAGVLLILMGLYVAGLSKALTVLERGGQHVWKRLQPLGKRFLPVKTFWQAYFFGAIWGWLPCGLVYTALAFAATQANVSDSTLTMLCFGLGTLPVLMLGGFFASSLQAIIQGKYVRWVMGALLLCFGCWTIFGAVQHLGHGSGEHGHASHQHPQSLHGEHSQDQQVPAPDDDSEQHKHHH